MNYELTKKENGIFEATIKVEKEEWEKALNSAYEKNKSKYTISGFRKGHAPRNIIEKTYGAGVFMNAALDEVYYTAYTTILKDHTEVQPIDSPKLDIKSIDENGVDMVMEIACVPDFTLAQYKGLEFKKQEVKVTDEDVEKTIERELLRASRLNEVERPIKDGDYVNLNFDGYVDGKPFDGGKAENYQLQIGSKTFIDGFEDQLIGLSVGEKKDVEVTFPADYHAKDLANKPAVFKCEILKIREREMPELNDEFVSNSTESETVEEYKKSIKDRLVSEAESRAEIEVENDMLDKIIDSTELNVPEVMAEEEFNRQYNGMIGQMQYQGFTIEDYAKYMNKTVDDIKNDIRARATRNVKARLVLDKLIKEEKLDITQADIDNKLAEMAKNVGKDVEEYKKNANNDMVNRIANELLMKKIVEFLRANNTVK